MRAIPSHAELPRHLRTDLTLSTHLPLRLAFGAIKMHSSYTRIRFKFAHRSCTSDTWQHGHNKTTLTSLNGNNLQVSCHTGNNCSLQTFKRGNVPNTCKTAYTIEPAKCIQNGTLHKIADVFLKIFGHRTQHLNSLCKSLTFFLFFSFNATKNATSEIS